MSLTRHDEFYNEFYPEKWVQSANDLPNEQHFAVLKFGSIYIPGDERSRTKPGHGHPGRHTTNIEYMTFKNEQHLIAWLQNQSEQDRQKIRVLLVRPQAVAVEVKLNIQPLT